MYFIVLVNVKKNIYITLYVVIISDTKTSQAKQNIQIKSEIWTDLTNTVLGCDLGFVYKYFQRYSKNKLCNLYLFYKFFF